MKKILMVLLVGLLFLTGCNNKPIEKIEDVDIDVNEKDIVEKDVADKGEDKETISIKIDNDKGFLVIEQIDDLPPAYEVFDGLTIGEEIRSNKAFLNINSKDARSFQQHYDNELALALSVAREAVDNDGQRWAFLAVQDKFETEDILSFSWIGGWFLYQSGGMGLEDYFITFDLNTGNSLDLKEFVNQVKYEELKDVILSDVKNHINEINNDIFFNENYPEELKFIDTVFTDINVEQESYDEFDKTFVYISSPNDFMITDNKIFVKYEVFYMDEYDGDIFPVGYSATVEINRN